MRYFLRYVLWVRQSGRSWREVCRAASIRELELLEDGEIAAHPRCSTCILPVGVSPLIGVAQYAVDADGNILSEAQAAVLRERAERRYGNV